MGTLPGHVGYAGSGLRVGGSRCGRCGVRRRALGDRTSGMGLGAGPIPVSDGGDAPIGRPVRGVAAPLTRSDADRNRTQTER